jgi:eukaryotic-like serine/threonine-protein kinase
MLINGRTPFSHGIVAIELPRRIRGDESKALWGLRSQLMSDEDPTTGNMVSLQDNSRSTGSGLGSQSGPWALRWTKKVFALIRTRHPYMRDKRVTTLNEPQVVRLLLIRALEEVEEEQTHVFSKEVRAEADCQARNADTELASLDRRAECLFGHLPEPLQAFYRAALDWMRPLLMAVIILGPILGMASNFLGHSSQFHIIKNPIVFLIVWNLGVYVVLLLLWHRRRSRTSHASPSASPGAGTEQRLPESYEVADDKLSQVPSGARTAPPGHNWFIRLLLRPIFEKLLEWRVRFDQEKDEAKKWTGTLNSYFTNYFKAAGPVVDARLHCLLHLLNIGLVVGAIAGTYVRGLFFEYNAVWESTFIHNPSTVATVLNAVLGMASLVLDGRWLKSADITPLLQSYGTPAGPWIHKLALTAMVLVVVPRSVLMLLSALRVRHCGNRIKINLSEKYFIELIRQIGPRSSCSRHDSDFIELGPVAIFRGDIQRTGVYKTQGIAGAPKIKWKFDTGGKVSSSPLIAGGMAYFGSNDGIFYAVDTATGQEKWRFPTQGPIYSSPALEDSCLCFVSGDRNLYCVDSVTGREIKNYRVDGQVLSSPLVFDGLIYWGTENGLLRAVYFGSWIPKWTFQAGAGIKSSPALSDGIICFGCDDGHIYAVDVKTGREKWKCKTKGGWVFSSKVTGTPAICNGVVYIGNDQHGFYAIDLYSGKALWVYNSEFSAAGSPAVFNDVAYILPYSLGMHAIDVKTGEKKWNCEMKMPYFASPSFADGRLFFVTYDGVCAVDARTGILMWKFPLNSTFASLPTNPILATPVIDDGVLYVGANNCLYALH